MASFGAGLVRESVYIQDFQKEFERMFDGEFPILKKYMMINLYVM